MALVTEDRKRLGLFAEMTVGENITICTLRDAVLGRASSAAAARTRHGRDSRAAQLGVKTAGVDARSRASAAAISRSASSAAGC